MKADQSDETERPASAAPVPAAVAASDNRLVPSERGTLLLFSIAGIRLRIHVVIIAITLVLGIQAFAEGHGRSALFFPAVIVAIAIHEMGHAFAARRLGQESCTVVLHPLARRPPAMGQTMTPRQEALTALAGPAANAAACLVIALALLSCGRLGSVSLKLDALFAGNVLTRFFALNLYLCAINLLPAFPFDGARAFRSILALRQGTLLSTRFVASFSLMSALTCGVLGVCSQNLLLSFLGVLFVSGAMRELYEAPIRVARQEGALIRDVIDPNTLALGPGMTAAEAAQAIRARQQSQYPVILGDTVLGVVARQQILREKPSAYLSGLMVREMICVSDQEPLTTVVARGLPTLLRPVIVTSTGTINGTFLGILRAESVQAWLAAKAAPSGSASGNCEAKKIIGKDDLCE